MMNDTLVFFFFFSSRRRHTRSLCDWSSDVCSSDLETADLHFVAELRFAFIHSAGNWGGAGGLGGARQGNMALAGQQAGGGIQSHPAGTGQIYFAPCVQIREITRGTGWPVARLHVGC